MVAELHALGLVPTAGQPQPRTMEYDDIARLVFTGNAIKERPTVFCFSQKATWNPKALQRLQASAFLTLQESMRMLPVLADGSNRTTTRDTWLGSHLIPRGTMVWVPLKGTFCSPHTWDRPEEFIPV